MKLTACGRPVAHFRFHFRLARIRFIWLCAFAAPVFLNQTAALAQQPQSPITILITASRFAETADETLAPVSIITRDDIERLQIETVEEALRALPGITLSNTGGEGKLTSLFLRGTESNHVLVLIDGVKVGSATAGTTPFENLPIGQIEKIEVVRGPRSSLYGSEAIGGVIQIFTRRGDGADGIHESAHVSAGSHDSAAAGISMSGGNGGDGGNGSWYHIGASAKTTGGFNACRGSQTPFAGCFVPEDELEDDDDGYQNRSFSASGNIPIGKRAAVEANFLFSGNDTEFDGSFQNETQTETRVGGVKATLRAGRWQSILSLGQSQDLSDNLKDGAYVSTFNTTRDQAAWQNNFTFGKHHRIIAGVDYLEDRVDGSDTYTSDRRENSGAFISWRTAAGAADAEASLRADDNEQFGDTITGGIGWSVSVSGNGRVNASYGTAFTAPTFNDLYSSGEFYNGNPDLVPEKSESIDLGFAYDAGIGEWSLNAFHTEIEDLIAVTEDFTSSINIGSAKITGLEISGAIKFSRLNLSANLTAQEAKDTGGGENHGKRLPQRANTTANFDANYIFGKYSLGASAHARGRSYDDPGNTRKLENFARVDARFDMRLHKNWTLGLKVGNLFDDKYETVAYYPQDGTNFLFTLRYASR